MNRTNRTVEDAREYGWVILLLTCLGIVLSAFIKHWNEHRAEIEKDFPEVQPLEQPGGF